VKSTWEMKSQASWTNFYSGQEDDRGRSRFTPLWPNNMSSADAQNIDPARYAMLAEAYIKTKRRYDLAKEALQPGEPTPPTKLGEPMKSHCGHVVPTPRKWACDNENAEWEDDEACPLCDEEVAIWPYESPTEEAFTGAKTDLLWRRFEIEEAVRELLNGRTGASMLVEDSD
jgi:hypothetical protein